MAIPNPYFKNVPGCGDLRMEQIVVDYVYPLLSVLKDDFGNRYLCMCFDTRGAQQWLITRISNEILEGILDNRVCLREPFLRDGYQKILAVLNYDTRVETFRKLNADEIPDECLPEKGEYLDPDEGEWAEYIQSLRRERTRMRARKHEGCVVVRFQPRGVRWKNGAAVAAHSTGVRYVR